MNTVLVPMRVELPWDDGRADARRFRRWLVSVGVPVLILIVLIPWLPLPEVEREELEELPPELARIVLEKTEPEIPPPPKPKPKPVDEQPIAIPQPETPAEVVPTPEPTVADAREKAAVSGLLAFKDAFADMREAVDMDALKDTAAIRRGAGEAATIDRSIVTSERGARSAGVNVTAQSQDIGGVALSGRETTKVAVPAGATGTGGVRATRVAEKGIGAGASRQRSIEEVRRVFDANKGAIFAIYNRALRSDPSLQGKVVLTLVINPSGQVVDCRVNATEIADDALVSKIVNRVRLFDFGRADVAITTINYPVHFLPS